MCLHGILQKIFTNLKLRNLQFAVACFVAGCHVRDINDVEKVGWLTMKERDIFEG